MSEGVPERVPLTLQWSGIEETSIFTVNQFLGQVVQSGEILLTFGQVTPPVILPGAEVQAEQTRQLPPARVKTVARFGLTPQRVVELISILQQTLDNHERIRKAEEADGGA